MTNVRDYEYPWMRFMCQFRTTFVRPGELVWFRLGQLA
jgi:hypothetical protein